MKSLDKEGEPFSQGSREKKLLQLELDKCPVYGYFTNDGNRF